MQQLDVIYKTRCWFPLCIRKAQLLFVVFWNLWLSTTKRVWYNGDLNHVARLPHLFRWAAYRFTTKTIGIHEPDQTDLFVPACVIDEACGRPVTLIRPHGSMLDCPGQQRPTCCYSRNKTASATTKSRSKAPVTLTTADLKADLSRPWWSGEVFWSRREVGKERGLVLEGPERSVNLVEVSPIVLNCSKRSGVVGNEEHLWIER